MLVDTNMVPPRAHTQRRVWEPSEAWASASGPVTITDPGEPEQISFVAFAVPAGQPRPRFRIMRMGRRLIGKAYSPKGKHSDLKDSIRAAVCRAVGQRPVIDNPVAVTIECWMPKAKSNRTPRWWSGIKPDIDNIAKCVLDGINDSGVWRDDSLVSRLEVSKIDSPAEEAAPRVIVTITILPPRLKEKK